RAERRRRCEVRYDWRERAVVVDSTRLRDVFSDCGLIGARQYVIVAQYIKRASGLYQRSERATATESRGDVVDVATRHAEVGISDLVLRSAIGQKRRADAKRQHHT